MNEVRQIGTVVKKMITEKYGESLLSRRGNERSATNRHIMAIAKSIKNYAWINSSIISISSSGEMLDGQNRLLALRALGWPKLQVSVCVYDENDITPELRSSFNKSRPQSLRDTMKMCFGWGKNGSRLVPFFSFMARMCLGDKTTCDEYLMLSMKETVPERFIKYVESRTNNELSSDMKVAFATCSISDDDKSYKLMGDVVGMIFTSAKCHARRIFDYINSKATFGSDRRRHNCSFDNVKRVIYAIDKYVKNESCPILQNVDQKKIDDCADSYIEVLKRTIRFD